MTVDGQIRAYPSTILLYFFLIYVYHSLAENLDTPREDLVFLNIECVVIASSSLVS